MKGLFITGTDTGVGKTVITACLLAYLLEQGVDVVAMKPVATGALPGEAEDVLFYRLVAGKHSAQYQEDPLLVNPVCLPLPSAPALAAEVAGVDIDPEEIIKAFKTLQKRHDFILVEGAGGLYVPVVGNSYLISDLARDLNLPLLIVARAGLGTINHTVLTIRSAQQEGLTVKGVIVNRFPPAAGVIEQNNIRFIEEMTGVRVLGVVFEDKAVDVGKGQLGNTGSQALSACSLNMIFQK